ncbi:hypothetical protein [Variovorax sp. UC122_21]|uniref:hypothetical protein n=1 Tax=Variovorax TaxID=34072 RepID=UPI00193334BC|nr:hypothetical protein INQ48_36875 [Variovorax paradoxus]
MSNASEAFVLDPERTRDLAHLLLDAEGRLLVRDARELAQTTAEERLLFGVRHGIYGLPTVELLEFLRARLAGRSAIEIGAGHGVLAQALAIPATDNRQQEEPAIRAYYESIGQPTIRYGNHVEKLDAERAVAKYRPQVVIACWVTHRFEASEPQRGGSTTGVDEASILRNCEEYIFIGNEKVHQHKPILSLPHERLTPPWLYSRALNGSPDFIAIWRRAPVPGVA